jgi:hypothetical protein
MWASLADRAAHARRAVWAEAIRVVGESAYCTRVIDPWS